MAEHSQPGSQSALAAIGGYCLLSRSTLGSQTHLSSWEMLSITLGTCLPHPHHETFSVQMGQKHDEFRVSEESVERGMTERRGAIEDVRQVAQVPCMHIANMILALCR